MACNAEDVVNTVYVQPIGSGLCGPYTIAHLADITPEESVAACKAANDWVRKVPNGLTTRQMYKALRWLGYQCEPRMRLWYQSAGEKLPDVCILCIKWWAPGETAHGTGHWVYYNRGWVVCSGPSMAGVYNLKKYMSDREGVCISYLEVTKNE